MKKIVMMIMALTSFLYAEAIDRTGPYVALGGGYTAFHDDGRLGTSKIDNSSNINLIGGVFINKYLSVELGLNYFNTFTNKVGDTTTIYTFEAITKAHYPVWRNRIDFHAAFGAGGMQWKERLVGVRQDDNTGIISGDLGVGLRAVDWLTINFGYRHHLFTLDHQVTAPDPKDSYVTRYNMGIGSIYTNIEVQF